MLFSSFFSYWSEAQLEKFLKQGSCFMHLYFPVSSTQHCGHSTLETSCNYLHKHKIYSWNKWVFLKAHFTKLDPLLNVLMAPLFYFSLYSSAFTCDFSTKFLALQGQGLCVLYTSESCLQKLLSKSLLNKLNRLFRNSFAKGFHHQWADEKQPITPRYWIVWHLSESLHEDSWLEFIIQFIGWS